MSKAAGPHAPGRGLLRAALRVPLFYKILLANAVLVLAGTLFGSRVTAAFVRQQPGHSWFEVAGLLAAIGIGITLLVNAVILRVALRPLEELERTAERVQRGEVNSRVPLSPVADRELERLRRTFNQMLDSGAAQRADLREVAARALGAAEEERKRIARELHDETAQMLAALLIRIRLVRRSADAETGALLDELRGEIAHALEGVRRFARGLRPPQLDELGLVPAIEAHARALEEISGIRVSVRASGMSGAMPPEAELATYRIVQEALSNLVRHSGASSATVEIAQADGAMRVRVEDDGTGFDPRRVAEREGGGLGLFGMRERAGYLGGTLEITSAPDEGTRVDARIPLSTETGTGTSQLEPGTTEQRR